MNAQEVISKLKAHFAPPSFCFLEQLADGTGARQHRWADGVAMNVWPSRGYDIHGIEVKVSKYDWKSELNNPAKSDAVQKFCNRWWIATPDESIIAPGELPPTWGWMVCKGAGMKIVVPAAALTPKALSVEFVASILRNFAKADETAIQRAYSKGHNEGYESGGKHHEDQYRAIKKECEAFEAASGLRINQYSGGKELGESVQTLSQLKWKVDQIKSAVAACESIKSMLAAVQVLSDLQSEIKEQAS